MTIAERALYGNKSLKEIYIPKSVTKIKGEAFSYMKKIQIKIASKNKYYFDFQRLCGYADVLDVLLWQL